MHTVKVVNTIGSWSSSTWKTSNDQDSMPCKDLCSPSETWKVPDFGAEFSCSDIAFGLRTYKYLQMICKTRKILHTWEDNSKIIGNLCLLETLYIALIKCVRNQSIKKFAIRSDANWALRQICYQSPISNLSRQSSRKTYMIPHFANNVGNPKLNRSEYNGDAVRLYYRDQTEHD